MSSPTVLAYLFPAPSAAAGEDDWRADAACQYIDLEIFFPDVGHRGRSGKQVCARCPAATRFRQWAIAHNETYGIWGGYLPRERFALRNTIRSWAQATGMACPPIGGVPVPVQIAYLRSHTEVAA